MGHTLTSEEIRRIADVRGFLRSGAARRLRLSLALSEAEVAASVPCDESALSRWETGKRVPRPAAALALAAT